MKSIVLIGIIAVMLNAFSLDGMIDSISDKVADSVGNKVSDSIDSMGEDTQDKNIAMKQTNNSKLQKLKELVQMRDAGYLTESEFKEAKKELFR